MKLKANKGFSIIELLAVTAITILLGSILLANTKEPTRKFELKSSSQILMADLRGAQAFAISAQSMVCGAETKVPYYGFRIQANSSATASYSVFADCDKNNLFNDVGSDDFIIETTVLNHLFVKSTDPPSGGADFLSVVYIPPIPDVAINGSTFAYPLTGEFTIELCHSSDSSLCVEIWGNSRGNVEIR